MYFGFPFKQTDSCKCNGWKSPNQLPTTPTDTSHPQASLTDPCRSCNHTLSEYHLVNVSVYSIHLKFTVSCALGSTVEVVFNKKDMTKK